MPIGQESFDERTTAGCVIIGDKLSGYGLGGGAGIQTRIRGAKLEGVTVVN